MHSILPNLRSFLIPKSHLLSTKKSFLSQFLQICIIFSSSLSLDLEASKIAKTISAFSTARNEFSMPIFSILSLLSRIPAVSIMRTRCVPRRKFSSIVSRVVPATSLIIARFSFKSAFKIELFPTFGLPIIAILKPSISPRREREISTIFASFSLFSFSIFDICSKISLGKSSSA